MANPRIGKDVDDNLVIKNGAVVPENDNDKDLGSALKTWKDIYLKGDLKDGVNNLSIADLAAHASRHASGGADPIKLDDLAEPDDNTDLNFSTTRHGLVPKGTNTGTKFLRDDGGFETPSSGTPDLHAASHENGGADEINVAGLSGELADSQPPKAHASDHYPAGSDELLLDEDDMASNSADKGASQQSIKAYVDKLDTIVTTITSSATPTPARASKATILEITALAEDPTFGAPTGTPVAGDILIIRIKDNGTPRTLSWNAIYRKVAGIPTITRASKTLYIGFIYNSTDSKWDCTGSREEP